MTTRRRLAALCSAAAATSAILLATALSGAAGTAPAVPAGVRPPPALDAIQAAREFRWPLAGPVQIVRPFDLPDQTWLAGHRGVDLASGAGAAVYAPAAGSVTFNGWIVDRHVLVISHGDLVSTLEPVTATIAVGAPVAFGELLGAVAVEEASHCPSCLHWGVRREGQYLDPALLVGPRPRAVLRE